MTPPLFLVFFTEVCQECTILHMSSYEIEIKSLLGDEKRAEKLIADMHVLDPGTKLIDENTQLNHYFVHGDMDELYKQTKEFFDAKTQKKLKKIIDEGNSFSIRTREINDDVRLVLKASISDDTSANGVSRMEFDESLQGQMSLPELDKVLLDAGFEYQAKWSRERKEYACNGANVSIDKNAGYGYLAEFEKVVTESSLSEETEKEIRALMEQLRCEELPQDRLERMFAFYNDNWPNYYGTDNVFVIE